MPIPTDEELTDGIFQVEYRALVSIGDYNNVALGATVRIVAGASCDADEALAGLRAWVDKRLEAIAQERREGREVMWELDTLRAKKETLEREVAVARERAEKVRAWLTLIGIPAPSFYDDMPFD